MKSAEILESRHIFAGRVVDLRVERVRLPNGNAADMEIVAHSGAVAVVAIDDRDQVLLVRQYRHATGEWF